MKKLFTFLVIISVSFCVLAQVPQKMSYQAVIRNSSDQLVKNQPIGMRVSILQGSITGIEVYKEIFNPNPQTNSNGLVTIEIGGGLPITGTFAAIDWSFGTYYIKIETDPIGGTNYTIMGTSQILSLPYALHAKTSETSIDAVKIKGNQTIEGEKTFLNRIIVKQQGIGTVTPNASAALEISSTTQGLLLPRMTQIQRDAITPVIGLIIYNTYTSTPNYYDGIRWMNFDGTPAIDLEIGATYRGGKIAYILQPGDPGYDPNVIHGLIAAKSNLSTGFQWYNGTYITTGVTATSFGTGNANTTMIVSIQGEGSYAAKMCYDLSLEGYTDWYLPSIDELDKLYINRKALGILEQGTFWSSSEYSLTGARIFAFDEGIKALGNKSTAFQVQPIRSF